MPISSYSICHEESNPIDYRPHVQHRLVQYNTIFDLLYSATLRTNNYYQTVYRQILGNLHEKLFEDISKSLIKVYENYKLFHHDDFINTFQFTVLRTCLSSTDTSYLVELMQDNLDKSISSYQENSHECPMLSVTYSASLYQRNSAVDILKDIYDLLHRKCYKLLSHRGFSSSSSLKKRVTTSVSIDNPMNSICNVLREFPELFNKADKFWLIVIIKDIDNLSMETQEQLLLNLSSTSIHVDLIGVHAAFMPVPLRFSDRLTSNMDVYIIDTKTPEEFYDSFICSMVSNKYVTVNFSHEVLQVLHELFWRSHKCVHTILDYFERLIEEHFRNNRTLLSMFMDIPWLIDMKVKAKSSGTNVNSSTTREYKTSINDILIFLGTSPFKDTNLLDNKSNKFIPNIIDLVFEAHLRENLDRALFSCLKTLRDVFFLDSIREKYWSDILWTCILSGETIHKSTSTVTKLTLSQLSLLDSFVCDIELSLSNFDTNSLVEVCDKLILTLSVMKHSLEDENNNIMFDILVNLIEDIDGLMHLFQSFIDSDEKNENHLKYLRIDFIDMVKQLVDKFQNIPRNTTLLRSIFSIDINAAIPTIRKGNGTIRLETMRAILHPEKHIPINKQDVLDSTLIANRVMQGFNQDNIFKYYDDFVNSCKSWQYISEDASNSKSNISVPIIKKVKLTNVSLTSEELNRLRFISTLHNLEKVGLIQVETSKPGYDYTATIKRNAFTWTDDN